MGKNPNTIFRELYKRARIRHGKIEKSGGKNPVYDMDKEDGCYYVLNKEVIKSFILEGYSEKRANCHITKWLDYDLITVRYDCDGTKYIGFPKGGL